MARTPIQPTRQPPDGNDDTSGASGIAGESSPMLDVADVRSANAAGDLEASAPQATPPASVAAGSSDQGITAMQYNKRVTALWTINEVRNCWAHVDGVGWRRLANNSDSGVVALNMLMAHARQMNARVDYDDGTGMITQAYVW
jgi:hypothetical protein